MSRIKQIDPDNATGKAGELLGAVKSKMGIVPNITRVMANEPAVLQTYLALSGALGEGTLDPKTREAIALAVAGANQCDYCASAHSAISGSLKIDQDEIKRRLSGNSSDPHIQAILDLSLALVNKRGFVSDDDLSAARQAGLNDGLIMEVVANVVANIFTNYINHVAETDIDFPVVRTDAIQSAA